MSNLTNTKSKPVNPRNVLGGVLGWLDETDLEREIRPVTGAANDVWEALTSLGGDIAGVEAKKASDGMEKLPTSGTLEFNKSQVQAEQSQEQREEVDRKKLFFQALKEDQNRAQSAKDKLLLEDEINDIVTNLPTEQKNRLLHYQASYRDRSIYQRAELRKKIIEDQKQAEQQQNEATIHSPAKQANAIDAAFEGGSGKSGSGSANFSATGGGAG